MLLQEIRTNGYLDSLFLPLVEGIWRLIHGGRVLPDPKVWGYNRKRGLDN